MPDHPTSHEPELLTITEAAELLRAPVATLRYWRHRIATRRRGAIPWGAALISSDPFGMLRADPFRPPEAKTQTEPGRV